MRCICCQVIVTYRRAAKQLAKSDREGESSSPSPYLVMRRSLAILLSELAPYRHLLQALMRPMALVPPKRVLQTLLKGPGTRNDSALECYVQRNSTTVSPAMRQNPAAMCHERFQVTNSDNNCLDKFFSSLCQVPRGKATNRFRPRQSKTWLINPLLHERQSQPHSTYMANKLFPVIPASSRLLLLSFLATFLPRPRRRPLYAP